MSTQMIEFNRGSMPANLSKLFGGLVGTDDLTHGAEAAFPILSIKGRVFRIKHGGEERVVQKEGQPIFALDVVLLKANKNLSKLYYAKAYAEGDDEAPSCSSSNGTTPDTGVTAPQSTSCATCPQNVWGSKITPQGTKTKACADMRRLALVPEKDMECKTWGAPMLLRVPAASLQGLSEYGRTVLGGSPYSAVVTRISFDLNVAYPKLTFAPVRWLEANEVQQVMRWLNEPIIGRIIGVDADPSAPNTQQRVIPIQPAAPATPVLHPAVQGYVAPIGSTNAAPAAAQVIDIPADNAPTPFAPPLNQEHVPTTPEPVPTIPEVVLDPLAHLPEHLRIAVNAVGGATTDAGKAIIATVQTPATNLEKPKRARRAATPAQVIPSAPVAVPATTGEFIPAQTQNLAPAPVAPAPVTQASSNTLLAGVDELLNGLESLNFDD